MDAGKSMPPAWPDLDPRAMWQHVAVVPQEYARWPLTARENIHLGRTRPDDGDEAVLRAAAASGADEVIAGLRNGLGTLLAREFFGGVALSSGQWQRLAVARGIYRQGGLLILDEPTSALDPQAEHTIFMGLRHSAAASATILVTHNLFNASIADRIVVLDAGRIAQEGTFAELSTTAGIFKHLLDLQNDRPVPRMRAASD
jgi:ATP-binding cassette subfamily B protein